TIYWLALGALAIKADVTMNKDFEIILNHVNGKRGFDFSGCRPSLIERLIEKRLLLTKCKKPDEYHNYLLEHPDELDSLVETLTINVSKFFRNTLTFEYLAERVVPVLVDKKRKSPDPSLRVWSAGCAMGEEPYSVAILIHEFLEKEKQNLDVTIFATDIDNKILQKAQKATYPFESIQNVKYRLLSKYFQARGESFKLVPEIKQSVTFLAYDMLDNKSFAPPESIYGDFDLVLCRNLLIYFNRDSQELIFDKLHRSLSKHGYLILGEAEIPSEKYQQHFKKVNDCCHVYQKR
ncbi:MAG: protein-glutamate O-methyltransferase CheR, partial [Desulfuromusa sp.]|nr:protein-glutamate O-methyltransferase CheR [Desulfuromusa sp.]